MIGLSQKGIYFNPCCRILRFARWTLPGKGKRIAVKINPGFHTIERQAVKP